ncbi:hypothetical protein B296_00057731 [Ensete ventricosum]|uniref:Uncharacterized protein n=1 Tax=Ensete ventricosum TaxID=4639 RepID=A0A426XAG8_ENSVE|nr:hypothetical protein B296_00057731 [Ensete ventricosum]
MTLRENEATPHSPAGGQSSASFNRKKMRQHLVLSIVSFLRGETPFSMVSPDSGRSTYQYPVGPVCTTRIGRYNSKRKTLDATLYRLETTNKGVNCTTLELEKKFWAREHEPSSRGLMIVTSPLLPLLLAHVNMLSTYSNLL